MSGKETHLPGPALLSIALAAALALAGCGKESPPAPATGGGTATPAAAKKETAWKAPKPPANGWYKPDPASVGSIAGKVAFKGDAPKMPPINMGADPVCQGLHSEERAKEETVIVNSNGTLRNVFVYVKKGLEGKKFEPPSQPVLLDQLGCQYHPHVFGVVAGQPINVRSSDETSHNIHSLPDPSINEGFNFGQPKKGMEKLVGFDYDEVMIKIKCDTHPWMNGFCGVLSHPCFSVTGEDGSFDIQNVPPGEYEVEAWHEKYGTKTQKVTLGAKESKALEFTFEAQ